MTPARPGEAAGPRLRVVTYNIKGGRGPGLAGVVRELEPDVLVVQEGPRRFRWRARCAELARTFGIYYAAGGLPALGNVIFVGMRVRPRETWCVRYPLTPGRHMRGAAYARCEVDGTEFLVAGTHLATDGAERPAQAALFGAELTRGGVPAVVCADLNETAEGESFRLVAAGRLDAAVVAGGEAAATPTYSTARPRRRIDVVLVDPPHVVESYRVVDTPAARAASDHFPVVADLRLPA
ncbi:MAG TPA: endonuclease/exonuclease/phosphatase family protein [Micromonosporaceae bacterium]|nr:endonuclease/exonuclease/phosphatase family protein [Micromonosporaceae bacterium]